MFGWGTLGVVVVSDQVTHEGAELVPNSKTEVPGFSFGQ